MLENHLLPCLMIIITIIIALTGIAPCLNIAIVGLSFGIFLIGFDFFLTIPSQIFEALYNFNWLCIPLVIFFSNLAKNLIIGEEILALWKTSQKKWLSVLMFFSILPMNSIFTGLIGGTGKQNHQETSSLFKNINLDKTQIDFIKINQLVCISLVPPSLVLIVLTNSTEIDLPVFFSIMILPAFLYALICQIFFIFNAKKIFLALIDVAPNVQIKRKPLLLKLLSPYIFLFSFLIVIVNELLTITQTFSFGVLLITFFIIFYRKNSYKTILISSYKNTGSLCSLLFFSYICSQFFLITFRAIGGDDLFLTWSTLATQSIDLQILFILIVIFILQFLFTWLEISFLFIPMLIPIISGLGIDIMWFLVLVCFSFHSTSFATPFGITSNSLPYKHRKLKISNYFKNYFPLFLIQIIFFSLIFFNPSLFVHVE